METAKILKIDKNPLPLFNQKILESIVGASPEYNPDGKLRLGNISHIISSPSNDDFYLTLGLSKWLSLEKAEVIDAPFDQATEVKKLKGWYAFKITHLDYRNRFEKIYYMIVVLRNGKKGLGIYNRAQLSLIEALLSEKMSVLHRLASEAISEIKAT